MREVGGGIGEGEGHGSLTLDRCMLQDPQARSGNISSFDPEQKSGISNSILTC